MHARQGGTGSSYIRRGQTRHTTSESSGLAPPYQEPVLCGRAHAHWPQLTGPPRRPLSERDQTHAPRTSQLAGAAPLNCFTALAAAGRCLEPIHPQPPGLCMNPQASRLSTCTRCPLASERPHHTRLPSLQVGSLPCCPTRCRDVRIVLLSLDTRGAPGPACDGLRCIGGCCVCAPMRREGAHARTTSEGRTARSRSARLGVMSICAAPLVGRGWTGPPRRPLPVATQPRDTSAKVACVDQHRARPPRGHRPLRAESDLCAAAAA